MMEFTQVLKLIEHLQKHGVTVSSDMTPEPDNVVIYRDGNGCIVPGNSNGLTMALNYLEVPPINVSQTVYKYMRGVNVNKPESLTEDRLQEIIKKAIEEACKPGGEIHSTIKYEIS